MRDQLVHRGPDADGKSLAVIIDFAERKQRRRAA